MAEHVSTSAPGDDHAIVDRLRDRIYRECDAAAILASGVETAAATVRALARDFIVEERLILGEQRTVDLVEHVVAATTGYGPLERLLSDAAVTEIMVNGPTKIFVERDGMIEPIDVRFSTDEHVRQVLDRILAPIGRRLDASTPMVDARLPDGSRVNAVIPPVAVDGTTITIRRFSNTAQTLDDLVRMNAVTGSELECLQSLLRERRNVVVSGGTGSGKTTLLAAALEHCDVADRLIVIEDAAELRISHPHCVRLESRPPSMDGSGEIRVRELVRNALRMRPDRLIVGEVRGAEAFDLIQAMNTGHRGGWSTVHSNGAEDALHRIESMALIADVGIPQSVLRLQIARAVDAVVHVERCDSGRRRVAEIIGISEYGSSWRATRLV